MAENNETPAPDANPARPSVNLPRRNISAERQQQQPPTAPPQSQFDDRLATLVDSVMVLASHLGTEQANSPELANDRSGRRVKKFQRSGAVDDRLPPGPETAGENVAGAPASEPAPAEAESAKRDAAAFNRNVAWPRQAGTEPPASAAPSVPLPKRKRPKKRVVALVVQLASICLVALGVVAGRISVAPGSGNRDDGKAYPSSNSPDGGGIASADDKALQSANEAMRKTHTGDLDGARSIYEQALKKHVDLPGVRYQLARLALMRDDFYDADLDLDRSSAAGEYLTPTLYTRARLAGMKGDYSAVVRHFTAATHIEPFNSRYFFYLGEALRRRGQTQNAIEVFEQALDRTHTTAEGRLYRLKQGFAKIEAGDAAFSAELDKQLQQASVTPEEWLFAAARHITRSEYPASADALKKAAALLPPPAFALQVKDYLFQAVLDEASLTGLLKTPPVQDSTELNGPFLDPSILPPELADPAIWPVAMINPHKGL